MQVRIALGGRSLTNIASSGPPRLHGRARDGQSPSILDPHSGRASRAERTASRQSSIRRSGGSVRGIGTSTRCVFGNDSQIAQECSSHSNASSIVRIPLRRLFERQSLAGTCLEYGPRALRSWEPAPPWDYLTSKWGQFISCPYASRTSLKAEAKPTALSPAASTSESRRSQRA